MAARERCHEGVVVVPVILGADNPRLEVSEGSVNVLELLLVRKRSFGGKARKIIYSEPKTGFINKFGVASKALANMECEVVLRMPEPHAGNVQIGAL